MYIVGRRIKSSVASSELGGWRRFSLPAIIVLASALYLRSSIVQFHGLFSNAHAVSLSVLFEAFWNWSLRRSSPWISIALYFFFVAALRRFYPVQKNGPKFKWLTFTHNSVLFVESCYMFYGFMRHIYYPLVMGEKTVMDVYCNEGEMAFPRTHPAYYFGMLYYLSKFHEMFDTGILIIRGRPVTNLGLFHHSVMAMVSWYNVHYNYVSLMAFAATLNCFVHIIMYGYFALSALGYSIGFIRKSITSMQITQFILILLFILPWPYLKFVKKYNCTGTWSVWLWTAIPVSIIMGFFINFFIRQYRQHQKKET